MRLGGLINNHANHDLVRSRELIQHHKSCSYLEQNSSVEIGRPNPDTRGIEPGNHGNKPCNLLNDDRLARFSHISTSTAATSSHYHQQQQPRQSRRSSRKSPSPISQGPKQQLNHISISNQTRVRKSFSMNDMKSFLMHERLIEQREIELVPVEPLRQQQLKSLITHSVTTPTLSPNSSLSKSLSNENYIEEEESSLGRGWT